MKRPRALDETLGQATSAIMVLKEKKPLAESDPLFELAPLFSPILPAGAFQLFEVWLYSYYKSHW